VTFNSELSATLSAGICAQVTITHATVMIRVHATGNAVGQADTAVESKKVNDISIIIITISNRLINSVVRLARTKSLES